MDDLLVNYVTEELKTRQDLTLRDASFDDSGNDRDPDVGSCDIVRRRNSSYVNV